MPVKLVCFILMMLIFMRYFSCFMLLLDGDVQEIFLYVFARLTTRRVLRTLLPFGQPKHTKYFLTTTDPTTA